MISRLSYFVCAFCIALTSFSIGAQAQGNGVQIEFTFQGQIDCEQPLKVNNFPFSGRGSGTLYANKRAALDLSFSGSSTSNIRFDAALGGAPMSAPGGTAQLRVLGNNRLRMIWSLPNNDQSVDIAVSGSSCTASVDNRLKRGARQYSVFDGGVFYFCAKPRITQTTCNIR